MPSFLEELNDQLNRLASIGIRSNRYRGGWVRKCQKRWFFFRRGILLPSDVPEKADRMLWCIWVAFMGKINWRLIQRGLFQILNPHCLLIESTAIKSVRFSMPKNSGISSPCAAPNTGSDRTRMYPDCNVSNLRV